MTDKCSAPENIFQPSARCAEVALRLCVFAGSLVIALVSAPNGWAGEVEVVVQGASDYLYRGTTETGNNPVLGVAIDWQATKRSFVGVEAHQAEVDGVAQRHRSFLIYAGTGVALGDKWYATALVSHREYPGSGREWDFTEFGVQLDHTAGWTFSVDYSPDYYEHNTTSVAAELGYRRDLSRRVYAYASVGAIEFSQSRFPDYQFGSVGAGLRLGQVVFDLSYHTNTEGNDSSFGMASFSNPRLVGQVSWRLR